MGYFEGGVVGDALTAQLMMEEEAGGRERPVGEGWQGLGRT